MRMLALVLICLIASGCAVISKEVNKNWPPLTTTDQQLKAANQSNENRISQVDTMLFLSSNDFNRIVKDISNGYFGKLVGNNIDSIAVDGIEIKKIALVKQGVLISGIFKLNLSKYNIKISGEMTGIAAITATDSFITILPAFSYVKLDSMARREEKSLISKLGEAAAIDLVNKILHEFISNINGVAAKEPTRVQI